MVNCANLLIPEPSEDPDPTIAFLKELAKRARCNGSSIPTPLLEPAGQHLELDLSDDSETSHDALEFD